MLLFEMHCNEKLAQDIVFVRGKKSLKLHRLGERDWNEGECKVEMREKCEEDY